MSSLGLILGAIEMGILVTSVMFGITLVQTYTYAMNGYSKDRIGLRVVVGITVLLETVQLILVWAYFYNLTVNNWGNDAAFATVPSYFNAAIAVQGTLESVVQSYFAFRLYTVSRKVWMAIPAWVGAFLQFCGHMAIAIADDTLGLEQFEAQVPWVVYIALSISCAVGLWNTIGLAWFLRNRVRQSGHTSTGQVVSKILVWTMETGFATLVATIMLIIFWGTLPREGLWVSVLISYGRLYATSLLVSLNMRQSLGKVQMQTSISTREPVPQTGSLVFASNPRSYNIEMTDLESKMPTQQNGLPTLHHKASGLESESYE